MYPLVYIVNSCLFSVNAPLNLFICLKKVKKHSAYSLKYYKEVCSSLTVFRVCCIFMTLGIFCVTYYMLNKSREDITLQEPFIKDILLYETRENLKLKNKSRNAVLESYFKKKKRKNPKNDNEIGSHCI